MQVKANRSAPVATWTIPPLEVADTRCGRCKLVVGFTVVKQLQ